MHTLLETVKTLLSKWGTEGLKVPHAHDAANNKPSVRLLFAYLSFVAALVSVVVLHISPSLLSATWTAIGFYVICTVLYMLKDVVKAKVDLDDKEVSFESSEANDIEKK